MLLEQRAIMDLDRRWAEAEEWKNQQVKPPTIWTEKKKKKSLWNKVQSGMMNKILDMIERRMRFSNQDSTSTVPHVAQQTIPMTRVVQHYEALESVTGGREIIHSNVLLLRRAYSQFRPVYGDGECFYRSFIFSYLEQVLDRQDTHEEHRLLAAVKGVATQHARLGWTSEFSRSHKAFKKLMKKVMRWKRHRRWRLVPSTNSYRKQKLLEFFSGYSTTENIFAFLRLVAAIWICSHSEEYELMIPELREDCNLKDWCFREVIRHKVFTDHVQITALVTALGVPLRVEYLFQRSGLDLYTGQDSQDDIPASTCWPRHRHLPPPGHEVPRVTVLYTNGHYDIIYPHRRDGPVPSIDESCSQQTAQGESSTGESSSQQIARGDSRSGERSSQQIAPG
ncbi:OVARIAN TUMOR DOMAIN-containing deubiquitinating enzyme 1-like [Phragmites australis]|uniref:OVARIAN TUMOR DOMAIN-containing deubiquitinating enzyme 1-like n=1 Tax=Phragmites australis TaxID=29695 RepID=UPI002D77FA1E|nr:OVARIAN TUMOR DOMAIN-containing deubiquitinating enzyme 1-like [Phragmites australis]